jgi:hypothetical protein
MNFINFLNNIDKIESNLVNLKELDDLTYQIKMGKYPSSFSKSDMFKIILDRLSEIHPFHPDAIKIIYCYDQILQFRNQVHQKNLDPKFYQKVSSLGGIDNYLALYFMMVRNLMTRLKMRDDFMFMNDHLHQETLKFIRAQIKTIKF